MGTHLPRAGPHVLGSGMESTPLPSPCWWVPTFWGESGLEFGSLLVSIPPTLFDVTSLLRLTETVLPVFGLFSVLVAHCRCY